MKIDSNSLLNTCLEIEGLLCLVSRRGNAVPENVGQLLVEKATKLRNNLVDFTSSASEEDEDDSEIAESAFSEEVADAAPEPEAIIAECTPENTVNLSDSIEETVAGPSNLSEGEAANVQDNAEIAESVTAHENDASPDDYLQQQALAAESAPIVRNDVAPVELTINDKFRFRRELFGNSDVDLAEALQVASQMSSVEEIEDYFYNDLCFDPSDETVKDFIRVVTSKHH